LKKRKISNNGAGIDSQQPPGTGDLPVEKGVLKKEIREEILVRLGNRVIEARGKLGLKQKDFAKELGVSSSYLSDIELGKTRPSFDFLISCYRKYIEGARYFMLTIARVQIRIAGFPMDVLTNNA
jgi:ribosome-binding protein aMBF1 (putative translation factor)